MRSGFAAAVLSIAAAGLGVAAALRAFLLAVLTASGGEDYRFAKAYATAEFAVLVIVAALLTAAMRQLSRQQRSGRTLLIVASVAAIAVTVVDAIAWPRIPGLVGYFNPVTVDAYRWAWLIVIALTVLLVALPVTARWFEEDPVEGPPPRRVAVSFVAVAAAAGLYQLWLFGTRLHRGWTLLSLLSPPELTGAEFASVIVLEAVVAALIAAVLLLGGAALSWRGRRAGAATLQVGALVAFGQAVFLAVDVDRVFTDIGFSAVTEILR